MWDESGQDVNTSTPYLDRCFAFGACTKLIVTGGWDRSLRVYDEVPREGDPPLLRQVEGAHSSDINVVSVSHRLGLIASGSAGGGCRLWDYQFLSCEGSCDVGSEALCVIFLEPHPLVAVGDAGGYVSIIPIRPWVRQLGSCGDLDAGNARSSCPLFRFANDQEAEGSIEGPASVTCLTHRGGGGMDGMILYTGDDKGTVRAWDMGDILSSTGCREAPEEAEMPRSQKYYDPRRRFNKQVLAGLKCSHHVCPPCSCLTSRTCSINAMAPAFARSKHGRCRQKVVRPSTSDGPANGPALLLQEWTLSAAEDFSFVGAGGSSILSRQKRLGRDQP